MDPEALIANIRSDLLAARKEQNVVKSQALFSLVNAIDNASAVDVPTDSDVTEVARHVLSADEVREIVINEIIEMQEASAMYKDNNPALVEEFKIKIAVLKNYI